MNTIDIVNEFLDDLRGGRMVDTPTVRVEQGQLQGRLVNGPSGKGFYSFRGIPYAAPPLGSLRFKAPQPPQAWEGVRDATTEGNVSAQIDQIVGNQFIGDENCLFLNVHTPNLDGEFLPVMVWIHGGSFLFGSGNSSIYGPDYLVEKDVVVVTINYRCGALGFLSLNTPDVPGNAGLKDVIQALKWVKQNIHNFGGNSGNITVFGESAGGAITSFLTSCPSSKNLISKAIFQSGSALGSWAIQKDPIVNARNLAKELGCNSSDVDDILEYLSATPVKDIVEANARMSPRNTLTDTALIPFSPVVETEFPGVEAALTETYIDSIISGRVAKIPIMLGTTTLECVVDKVNVPIFMNNILNVTNADDVKAIEGQVKELYFKESQGIQESSELISDLLLNHVTHRLVTNLTSVSDQPIFYYKFDYIGEMNLSKKLDISMGLENAGHMDELGYLFNIDLLKDIVPTPQDLTIRERMVRLWTNFAKSGNPTSEDNYYLAITWPPVAKDKLCYLNINNELSLKSNPNKERMQFWDDIYAKYYKPREQFPQEIQATADVVDSTPVIIQETIIHTTKDETAQNVIETKANLADFEKKVEEIQSAMDDALAQNGTDITVVKHDIKESSLSKLIENTEGEEIKSVREIVTIYKESHSNGVDEHKLNGNADKKPRPSNEIKMVQSVTNAGDVIRANDPPEDDLPKNIGVNKFVNFFESLGKK